MGDLPKKKENGLIVMGDLPEKTWWSHCNGWPTQMKDGGLIMMGDLPRKNDQNVNWSRCNGWPTQIKNMENWSRCNGWPTQKKYWRGLKGALERR